MSQNQSQNQSYFQGWYKENKQGLNNERRNRYQTDPEYRAKVLERNQEARSKRKKELLVEKRKEQKAIRVKVKSQPWKTIPVYINIDGKLEMFEGHTIGMLAQALDRSVQAIRLWERQGDIPGPTLRTDKGDRLYTANQIEEIREILIKRGKIPSSAKVKARRPPKSRVRTIRLSDGSTRKVRLFPVGVLADTVGRTVVTLEQREKAGSLPSTPFRASKLGHRLYTLPMIEAVLRAFKAQKGQIRGKDDWAAFRDSVSAAWTAEGIMGASLEDSPEDADLEVDADADDTDDDDTGE